MKPPRLSCHLYLLLALALIGVDGSDSAWGDDVTDVAAAAAAGDLRALKVLLESHPALVSSRVVVPATAREGFPGLYVDSSSMGTIGVDLALAKRSSPPAGYTGLTPLHLATLESHKEIVEFLVAHNANVNEIDNDGWTPLIYAASHSVSKDIAELLIAHGADVNIRDHKGFTALHWAARNSNGAVAGVLLSHHADVNAHATDLTTPLYWAVLEPPPTVEMVTLLLSFGADVNSKDRNGITPLHNAAFLGNTDALAALLASHADINAKRRDGDTPLHTAAFWGNLDAVRLLLAHGAEINAKNRSGWTPLRAAEEAKRDDVAALLLKSGGQR